MYDGQADDLLAKAIEVEPDMHTGADVHQFGEIYGTPPRYLTAPLAGDGVKNAKLIREYEEADYNDAIAYIKKMMGN